MEAGASRGTNKSQNQPPAYAWNGSRREFKDWFKVQVVEECQRPGSSVSIVARRHDINANVLFRWRREYRLGLLRCTARPDPQEAFAAVGVIGADGMLAPAVVPAAAPARSSAVHPGRPRSSPAVNKALAIPAQRLARTGSIELLLSGKIKVRVQGEIDKETLRHVLAAAREFA